MAVIFTAENFQPVMTPKSLAIDGFTISYLEANSEAQNTIFFIHGNSCSSKMWEKQLTDEALKNFRLIAFDLPGHGLSSAFAIGKMYSMPSLAEILSNAIKELSKNNGDYILTGFSLGTNAVAETLAFDIEPAGMVIAGSCLLGGDIDFSKVAHPEFDATVIFTGHPPKEQIDKYWDKALPRSTTEEIGMFRQDYDSTDSFFRSTILQSALDGQISNEIELVQQFNKPVFFVFGTEETSVNNDYLNNVPLPFWKGAPVKIPGAGHFVTLEKAETFNSLLVEYANEVFK